MTSTQLANSQEEKDTLSAELYFCKKQVEDFESLQKWRNALKEECDEAVLELDLVKKRHAQAHD